MEGASSVEREAVTCVMAAVAGEDGYLAICLSEQAQPWLAEGVQVARVISQGGLPKSGLAGIQSLEGGGC